MDEKTGSFIRDVMERHIMSTLQKDSLFDSIEEITGPFPSPRILRVEMEKCIEETAEPHFHNTYIQNVMARFQDSLSAETAFAGDLLCNHIRDIIKESLCERMAQIFEAERGVSRMIWIT
jgi:hypothetical protein